MVLLSSLTYIAPAQKKKKWKKHFFANPPTECTEACLQNVTCLGLEPTTEIPAS